MLARPEFFNFQNVEIGIDRAGYGFLIYADFTEAIEFLCGKVDVLMNLDAPIVLA